MMETKILGILSKVQNQQLDLFEAYEEIRELNIETDLTLESVEGHVVRYVNNPDKADEVLRAIVETMKTAGRLKFVEMKGSDKFFSFGVIGNGTGFGLYQEGDEEAAIKALTLSYVSDIDFNMLIKKVVHHGDMINNQNDENIN